MSVASYDPKNVIVTFNNKVISGFDTEQIIKAMRAEAGWTYKPSLSGRGARSRNPNKAGTVEISLHNKSSSNADLTAMAIADEQTGEGVGALLIVDRNTQTALVQAANAWIEQLPDFERAKEVGATTWKIFCEEIDIRHDGLPDT